MKYGIELEFFIVDKDNKLVPAFKVTSNVDGNPVIGEVRTGVHDNIVDCVYELKKLLFLEKLKVEAKGYKMDFSTVKTVDDIFLKELRKSKEFMNKKENDVLEELSIYPKGAIGKMLPRNTYKASLQINLSENKEFTYTKYNKVTVEDKYKYDSETTTKSYSGIFDYLTILFKLDEAFLEEIKEAKRVKGVYAIKNGKFGNRIEYRSLPNNIDHNKLILVLKGKEAIKNDKVEDNDDFDDDDFDNED